MLSVLGDENVGLGGSWWVGDLPFWLRGCDIHSDDLAILDGDIGE